MRVTRQMVEQRLAGWLRQGISPRRLALTLALGFTIGCVPVVGIPTLLCAGLALALGLNLPAIQVANYAAMPFQLALIAPFLRLGSRLSAFGMRPVSGPGMLLHLPVLQMAGHLGGMAGEAVLGWGLVAAPAALLLTAALTLVLQRIPAIAASEAAD
jgi:uncharacterized protein (DUF2062 family)